MDKRTLNAMVRSERTGKPLVAASKLGLSPIYLERRFQIKDCYRDFFDLSQKFWTYRGFSGLSTPWHDDPTPRKIFNFQKKSLQTWLDFLGEHDIHWKTFLVLSLCMADYTKFERPALLTGSLSFRRRFLNLRKYAGSRQRMDDIAFFMLEFIQLQIERTGFSQLPIPEDFLNRDLTNYKPKRNKKGELNKPSFVLSIYRRISDRIGQLELKGIDYVDWMRAKADLLYQKVGSKNVTLSFIVNHNSFEPDLESLRVQVADPWREIKSFLGLPSHCGIRDGCIPKGWLPATEDHERGQKIVSITKDGYYYYADGTQWRGKRHYATNKYLVICCTPENFHLFVDSWYDTRLLTGVPTWEEYEKWGLYRNIWDERGQNISGFRVIKNVKWRKP